MNFDYERNTRKFYQNDATAQRYHQMFVSSKGWRNLPSRVVARKERRAIETLLAQVPHRTALDMPAGTGKLAGIFATLGTQVVASDISASMLKVAEAEYAGIGYDRVSFRVADASDLGDFGNKAFDVAVCLRLMHRVPTSLRRTMLGELAHVASHAIVSFGIENGFHAMRRSVRASVFGGSNDSLCFCSMAEARAELEPMFEIARHVWIAPALSQEVIFLLKPKPQPAGDAA
ncbi:MAG: class I SAM-dependent methyltransferase [Xanthomonadales bacterium]|nr:class I SAM-dependent methyltransferase [Xanthomonadales bacterium]ODU95045.1 MAG: hypothetical protein ABT18_01845 [Rhodanobacter sp. SCN 66-43]OJY82212.1 MAG: hypothetical protein BGP23_01450 [Xanthomonadales bacterium 66-474]